MTMTTGNLGGSWYNNTGTGTITINGDLAGSTIGVSGITVTSSMVTSADTESGTKIKMVAGRKQIHPKLYFKFVKSKIKETHLPVINNRLLKVQGLLKNFDEMGQEAPFELLMVELFKLTKHAEAIGAGYSKVVEMSDLDKFRSLVNAEKRIVKYDDFTNFPRPVPKKNKSKILEAKKTNIFDSFKILYLDYSNETLKTTKQKIIEKDPIVFGVFKEDPTKHFFITDWVDDVCDLTLLQLIDTLKEKDKNYDLVTEEKVDADFLKRIQTEYEVKRDRLNRAVGSTYKELAKDEEIDRLKKELAMNNVVKITEITEEVIPPKTFWGKLWRR